jgi:hypothetical protein
MRTSVSRAAARTRCQGFWMPTKCPSPRSASKGLPGRRGTLRAAPSSRPSGRRGGRATPRYSIQLRRSGSRSAGRSRAPDGTMAWSPGTRRMRASSPDARIVSGCTGRVRTVPAKARLGRGSGPTDLSRGLENVPGTLLPNLLPNSVARDGTRTDRGRFRDRKSQTIRDVLGRLDTRRYGRDRISRPVPKPLRHWMPNQHLRTGFG